MKCGIGFTYSQNLFPDPRKSFGVLDVCGQEDLEIRNPAYTLDF